MPDPIIFWSYGKARIGVNEKARDKHKIIIIIIIITVIVVFLLIYH